ncbi:ERF family protein [Aquimarina longa]|uniref:ERF family protein n=1 Tax=Aquimarina longa TaxID=1080221 RepID=UPI0007842604|nr:ERF family protein [Aquimarina longa]
MEESVTDKMLTVASRLELGELGKALTIFQSKCPTVEKNSQGYGYKYADLASITETIKPHLKEAGLSYTQQVFNDSKNVGVKTILIHGTSGQYISSTIDADMISNKQKQMSPVQGMGSIITFLRRYALSSILGIVTDDDIDGITSSKAISKEKTGSNIIWLNETQFKKCMKSDAITIQKFLKAFSTSKKKMKPEHKKQLENRIEKLSNQ